MKKKLVICLMALAVSVSLVAGIGAEAPSAKFAYEMFDLYGATAEFSYVLPEGDDRSGVRFTGVSGDSVGVRALFGGTFDADFRILGVKSLSFSITDAKNRNNSFDIVIDSSSLESANDPQVSVRANGDKAGIWYRGGLDYGNTSGANARGQYTTAVIGRDSFNIGFDSAAGEVWTVSGGRKFVVWNVYEPINDGREFDAGIAEMESFSVEICFSDASEGSAVVVYSLGGQSLGGNVLTDDAAPGVSVNIDRKAVAGEKFTIPTAVANDIIDGVVSSVEVSVTKADGEPVLLEGKGGSSAYALSVSEDPSFIPNGAGDYIILYKATDSAGNTAYKRVLLTALAKVPDSGFSVKLGEETVGSGISYPVFG